MSTIGQPKRAAQNRANILFRDYLGDWAKRDGSSVKDDQFPAYLTRNGYSPAQISKVVSDMDAEIATLQAKLAKARQVKQGMVQELLTGRIRMI